MSSTITNSLKLLQLVSLLFFISISEVSHASDSIYIKFIHKLIPTVENRFCFTLSNGKELYVFTQCSDSAKLKCMVFKANRLVASGNLIVNIEKNQSTALRSGYWEFPNLKNKHKKREYYDNDKILKEEELLLEKEKIIDQ